MLRVLGMFFTEPSKAHALKDISRNVGIAHTSVKANLTELTKQGLITKEVQIKGSRKFPVYKANTGSTYFKNSKIVHNLTALLESGLIGFLEEKIAPKVIILFGSYRRGEDAEDSDVDIFVEGIEETVDLRSFEKKLKRKIQLHFNKDFKTYPTELRNNIVNGIVVHGFLEAY